jgi:hypothetical protein
MKHYVGIIVKRDATAMVLSQGDVVVAADLTRDRSTHDRARAFFRMEQWMAGGILKWIAAYQIQELGIVFIEDDSGGLPGVNRLPSHTEYKLRMAGAMEAMVYRMVDSFESWDAAPCRILLGRIGYRAAKSVFTGDGNASKTKLILASMWSKGRNEKFERERSILATAQAASCCRPTMIPVEPPPPLQSSYTESFTGG